MSERTGERAERPSRRRVLLTGVATGGASAGCPGVDDDLSDETGDGEEGERTGDDTGNGESSEAIAYVGSHPGSFACVERRPSGVSIAAPFNGRHPRVEPSRAIARHLEDALETVEGWP